MCVEHTPRVRHRMSQSVCDAAIDVIEFHYFNLFCFWRWAHQSCLVLWVRQGGASLPIFIACGQQPRSLSRQPRIVLLFRQLIFKK